MKHVHKTPTHQQTIILTGVHGPCLLKTKQNRTKTKIPD
jgi:hypothetical protein